MCIGCQYSFLKKIYILLLGTFIWEVKCIVDENSCLILNIGTRYDSDVANRQEIYSTTIKKWFLWCSSNKKMFAWCHAFNERQQFSLFPFTYISIDCSDFPIDHNNALTYVDDKRVIEESSWGFWCAFILNFINKKSIFRLVTLITSTVMSRDKNRRKPKKSSDWKKIPQLKLSHEDHK